MLQPTSQPLQTDSARLEVPDARFEAELARGQRAGRADVGDAGATSSCRAASPGNTPTSVDAPRLKKASSLVPVISDVKRMQRVQWMQRFMFCTTCGPIGGAVHARIRAFELAVARVHRAVVEGVVLQRALAGFVADRAVERMVDEQELHLPLARLVDLLVPDVDLHPVLDRGRAAGLQLGHAFDLDEAHAALADDGEAMGGSRNGGRGCRRLWPLRWQLIAILNFDFDSVDGDLCHTWFSGLRSGMQNQRRGSGRW